MSDLNADGILDIYALEANGLPGCTACLTNYPDYLYLGSYSAAGAYQSGTAGTFQTTAVGSGDTVNAIRVNGRADPHRRQRCQPG